MDKIVELFFLFGKKKKTQEGSNSEGVHEEMKSECMRHRCCVIETQNRVCHLVQHRAASLVHTKKGNIVSNSRGGFLS